MNSRTNILWQVLSIRSQNSFCTALHRAGPLASHSRSNEPAETSVWLGLANDWVVDPSAHG